MVILGSFEDNGFAFKSVRVVRVGEITIPELFADNTGLHNGTVEEIA